MSLLAIEFPPIEFLIFAVAMLLALVGKVVEFAKKVREKSLERERREGGAFRVEVEERPQPPEPPPVEPPPVRVELRRRPPRPRREAPPAPVTTARPARPVRPAATPEPAHEHPIVKKLREPGGAKAAIVLAEILGRPKAMRR